MRSETIIKARMQAKGLFRQGHVDAGKTLADMASELETIANDNALLRQKMSELLEVTKGYQEWVMAVPGDLALPAMPGLDGDWASNVMDAAQKALKQEPTDNAEGDCVMTPPPSPDCHRHILRKGI